MDYLISAIWVFMELLSFFFFCKAFLSKRRNEISIIAPFVIVWLIMFSYHFIKLNTFVQQLITFVITGILAMYMYRGSWIRYVLIIVLHYVFIAALDTIAVLGTSTFLGMTYDDLVWRKLTYTAVVTVTKLFESLIAYITYRARAVFSSQKVQAKWLLLAILFPAVSLAMIFTVFSSYKYENDLSVSSFVLICIIGLANIAILYLIRIMEKNTIKERQVLLLNQQMEIQTRSILDLEKSYRAQRRASHEFQRQLQTIHDLLAKEETSTALEYVKDLQETQTTRVFSINSHHPVIDVVLNQKYQVAKENSIEMQVQINDLSTLRIKTDILVVLLSNLLDNAIEACQRMPEGKQIQCSLLAGDSLFISIRNTTLPVAIIDGYIPTLKESKCDHGYGLINTKHILDEIGAEYTFQYQDGWFQFATEIPLE